MSTIKIKVGTLVLTAPRDEDLPQEFAAWHQTVRIEPGSYDVFAYLGWEHGSGAPGSGHHRLRSLSAQCEGVTVSSNFRSHMFGTWGKSDNNRNGQRATAHVQLPTYGTVDAPPAILAQATLCDAIVRTEWDPADHGMRSSASTPGLMWRFSWNRDKKPIVIEAGRYGGYLSLAAFEDTRRFRVDAVEVSPAELAALGLWFHGVGLSSADQLTVGETAVGWSSRDKRHLHVTRVA